MRAAKTVLATVLAALVIFGALGHRPAAAAGLPRFAAPRLVGHHSVTRAGTATVVTTVISKVFTALAAGAGKSLAQVIAQNDPALGWLLPAAAQRELLHTQQLKAVNDSLASLKQQVAGAQHQIAVDGFTNLVAHTHKVRSAIKEASDQLQELAELPANSRDAVQDAETLRKYIADNLLTAPEELNEVLAPDVPLASNPIEGASRLVMHRDRFFGPNSSAEVTSVYTVFAAYQTQLAVLLQNYYHATPGEFSPTRIQNNLKRLHGGNWQMPADGDMSKLLEGASGTPLTWLRSKVEVPLNHQLIWTSNWRKPATFGEGESFGVTIFDLNTGKVEQDRYGGNTPWRYPCKPGDYYCTPARNPGLRDFLKSKSGGLLLLRYLAPGESYWW
jgi:hypothetical protein